MKLTKSKLKEIIREVIADEKLVEGKKKLTGKLAKDVYDDLKDDPDIQRLFPNFMKYMKKNTKK